MSSTMKLERIDGGPDQYDCDGCEKVWTFDDLENISDISERVDPGGTMPCGQCPDCGALCYPKVTKPTLTREALNALLTLSLYRIGIREKEPDKRKNSTVHEYVVMAGTLDEAKAIAVAEYIEHNADRLGKIAAVGGQQMALVYHSDIYGSKSKDLKPETIPGAEALQVARERIDRFLEQFKDGGDRQRQGAD